MLRLILPSLFIIWASLAGAQTCPDFFRFVDFGLEGRDGGTHRGGPVFRAESFAGEPLLLKGRAECLAAREVSKDGPGNPIPIVTSIHYDPAKMEIDLSELRVFAAKESASVAKKNAALHQTRLDQPDTIVARGPSFLCISAQETDTLSCQLVSPYPGNAALVVYCDAHQCTMPALVVNERILIRAVWASRDALVRDGGAAGREIQKKIHQIHDVLSPLSSGL